MNLELGLVAASALVFAVAATSASVLSSAVFPLMAKPMARLEPASRANFLSAIAGFPVLAGLLVVSFTLAPSIAHSFGYGVDHCHTHGHHPHLCILHTVMFTGSTPERLLLASLGVSVLVWFTVIGARLQRQRHVLRMLVALGRTSDAEPRHCVLRSSRLFAITAGWLQPTIVVSSRMIDVLTPGELTAVLAHEQAHQRRRDSLRLLIAEIVSKPHWPATRRRILGQLNLAIEQACDEAAARRSGDRLGVAETIVKLTRLGAVAERTPLSPCPSFIGADATLRVNALLQPSIAARRTLAVAALLSALGLTMSGLATSEWWHHTAESLLGPHLG